MLAKIMKDRLFYEVEIFLFTMKTQHAVSMTSATTDKLIRVPLKCKVLV